MVALRNPSAAPQNMRLDLAAVLELPRDAARSWRVTTPRRAGEPAHWSADAVVPVSLKPFEVQLWDLQPE